MEATTTQPALLTCDTCPAVEPHTGAHCHLSDGRILCVTCWNNVAAGYRAERKVQLAEARSARKAAAATRPTMLGDTAGWAAAAQLSSRLGRR